MVEKEKYFKIKNSFLKEYLELKGINTKKLFKCVSPNHEDKNPSMSYHNNRCHCFGCGKNYNIFELVGLEYGINDYQEQVNKAAELYDNRELIKDIKVLYKNKEYLDNIQSQKVKSQKKILTNEEYMRRRYKEYVFKCKKNINKTNYLEKRGISKEVINRFNIGYDENFKNGEWKAIIIPTNWGSFTARNTDSSSCDKVRKVGKAQIFNFYELQNDIEKNEFIIVEGEIDALSLETLGKNAIALGSVNNTKLLMEKLKEIKREVKYYLMLDNDEVGKTTQKKLYSLMKEAGYQVFETNILDKYKDINEFLMKDPINCKKNVDNKIENFEGENMKNKKKEALRSIEILGSKELSITEYTDKTCSGDMIISGEWFNLEATTLEELKEELKYEIPNKTLKKLDDIQNWAYSKIPKNELENMEILEEYREEKYSISLLKNPKNTKYPYMFANSYDKDDQSINFGYYFANYDDAKNRFQKDFQLINNQNKINKRKPIDNTVEVDTDKQNEK